MDGDEKYCLAAEEAIDRTWRDEPAFPGMNNTGMPTGFVVGKNEDNIQRAPVL